MIGGASATVCSIVGQHGNCGNPVVGVFQGKDYCDRHLLLALAAKVESLGSEDTPRPRGRPPRIEP